MRNERLSIIREEVVGNLNSQMETVSQLSQSCLNVKATLTVAPEKSSMLGGDLSFSSFIYYFHFIYLFYIY
jgi:hypothetical protein